MAKYYTVKVPFRVDRETGARLNQFSFGLGSVVSLSAKDAKRWEPFLVPLDGKPDTDVEQATAAPGETRNVNKPKKG